MGFAWYTLLTAEKGKGGSWVKWLQALPSLEAITLARIVKLPDKTGVLNLFCLVYPLPKEKYIIYPQCTTTAFSIPVLKIKVFFSL